MKTLNLFLFLIFVFFFASINCTKDKFSKVECANCPQCMIDELSIEPVRNPPAKLYKWTINNKIYYYIPPFCCDAMSQLYDLKCNRICSPEGGLDGGGDGKCPPTFPVWDSIPKELIWADGRK